jgi:uncharacterized membrane protein YdjX (TVP38/TMEM64 family)
VVRFALVVLGLALAVALPFALFGDGFERALAPDAAVRWLEGYGHWAWLAGIGLLVADLVLPIPGSAVMAALGMIYGPLAGGAVAALGSFAAGLLAYGLCRTFGQRAFAALAGPDGDAAARRLFDRAGGWLVALSRWLPILPETVACLAGLTAMRLRIFAAALACGAVPLGFTFAAIGHLGVDAPVTTLAASALAPVALWAVARPWARRLAAPG